MSEKFEIYKLAVEMADRVSSRRMIANGFFLSVHTALAGSLGFLYEKVTADQRGVLIILSAVGILLALTWFFSIKSYKRLNKAKFAVINKMEEQLSFQYFTEEWAALRKAPDNGEPKTLRERWISFKDRYTNLTNIESVVPIAFVLIYATLLLGAVFGVGIK